LEQTEEGKCLNGASAGRNGTGENSTDKENLSRPRTAPDAIAPIGIRHGYAVTITAPLMLLPLVRGRGMATRRRRYRMKQKKEIAEKKRPEKLNLCKMLYMTESDFMEVAEEFYIAVRKYKNNLDIGRYMIASRGQKDKMSFVAGFCFGRYIQKQEDARAIFQQLGYIAESQEGSQCHDPAPRGR